jgi:hypothetical protein
MQRVLPIPLAILVQFKLIACVVLVPLRMVIAAGTLAASEGDMNDGFAFFCHGLIPWSLILRCWLQRQTRWFCRLRELQIADPDPWQLGEEVRQKP